MIARLPVFALILALPLNACAAGMADGATQTDPRRPEPRRPVPGAGATCDAAAVQPMLGERATAELGPRLLAESGARTLRWAPPGAALTMDFRPDRLTVSYGRDYTITRLSCG